MASKGDVIELTGSAADGFIELRVESSRSNGKPLNSTARLSLALAEANIVSQQARYGFEEDPFRVLMAWPVADMAPLRDEDKLSDA